FAKALEGFVVRFSRDHGVRQIPDRRLKFLVGKRNIFGLHGGLAPHQGRFALRYGTLAPLNFPFGDVIWILGEARRAKERDKHPDENGSKRWEGATSGRAD